MAKRLYGLGVVLSCMAVVSLGMLLAPAQAPGFEIAIEVAPSTLNIQSQSQVVTVHTAIAYTSVEAVTVSLNGIPIDAWKADNQGNFVAKFLMTEVKALAESGAFQVPGENTLTLVGTTTDGAEFTGSRTITVINVVPVKLK